MLFLMLQAAVAAGVLFLSDSYKQGDEVETAANPPAGDAEEAVTGVPATTAEISVVEKSSEEEVEEPLPPPAPAAASVAPVPDEPEAMAPARPPVNETPAQPEPDEQAAAVEGTAAVPEAVAPPAGPSPEAVPPAEPPAEPAAVVPATPQPAAEDGVPAEPVSSALASIPEPIAGASPQQPGAFPRLPGEVFRDCAQCPELVVIVAPSASEVAAVGDGAADGVEPASVDGVPRPYAIGRFEITFAEWDACVSDGGCTHAPSDEGWGRNALPVINISHEDIDKQYLPWLSRRAGIRYRLPTAAEWEHAAGDAGAAAAGSACETRNAAAADICDDGFEHTSPAGALRPNAAGLFDMYGNVWEWVADCWTPGFSDTAPKEPDSCEQRRLRGGSWSSTPTVMSDGGKGWEIATRKRNSIGFRVARDLP